MDVRDVQRIYQRPECDHVIALWRGGDDAMDNLQGLCSACHAEKTQREENERISMLRRAKATRCGQAPLVCTQCEHVVSPYFKHVCVSCASVER